MRVTQLLYKKFSVRNQHESSYKIPFQELYPLALRDKVHNSVKQSPPRPCIPQLTVLLQCFKDTDFNQTRCAESLKAFNTCIAKHNEEQSALSQRVSITQVKRQEDLTTKEINQLLKMKPLL